LAERIREIITRTVEKMRLVQKRKKKQKCGAASENQTRSGRVWKP